MAAFFVTLALCLNSDSAAFDLQSSAMPTATTSPVELKRTANGQEFSLDMSLAQPSDLSSAEQLILPLATYHTRPDIVRAQIQNEEGICVAASIPRPSFTDNSSLIFERSRCPARVPWPQQMRLLITAQQADHLAAWGSAGNDQAFQKPWPGFALQARDPAGLAFFIKGNLASLVADPPLPKYKLLDYMWTGSSETLFGVYVLILAFGLMLAATTLFFWSKLKQPLVVFCYGLSLFLSLGLLSCYVCPPLQAPDEPDHILSYVYITHSTGLSRNLLPFAQRNHFERLKFHSENIFTSSHLTRYERVPFAEHIQASDIPHRAPLYARIWELASPSLQALDAGFHVFSLRLLNLILAALGFALAMPAYGFFSREQEKKTALIMSSLVFCTGPLLFFFAMHVSNYGLTVSAGLLSAGLLFHMLMNQKNLNPLLLLPLGLAVMTMSQSSSAGLSSLGFWYPLLLLAPLTFEPYPRLSPVKNALLCSLLLSVGLSIPLLIAKSFDLIQMLSELRAFLGKPVVGPGLLNHATVLVLPSLLLLRLLLGAGGKRKLNELKLSALLSSCHLAALLLFSTLLVLPLLLPPSRLPDIESLHPPMPALSYVVKVLKVMALNQGLGPVDFYLSSSFWGGIGWLEKIFDDSFVRLLRTLVSLGIVLRLFETQRSKELRPMVFNLAIAVGIAIMLIGSAYERGHAGFNLHGRYLIPYYLLLMGVSVAGWVKRASRLSGPEAVFRLHLVVACIIFLAQAYGLTFIISRYFGPLNL